ncbi:Transposon Tf2-6 poly [Paramuricea clavata]|uniref:Transposon Tf2-6 poly n=1 Tax=Paramuricea clavata TaxID=317549 RepID=A0A6S7H1Z2_PARCT|nr:Transposon Tf2-6 poly [Paramuricea clavata]
MAKDIEYTCSACFTCTKYGKQAAAEPMLLHPVPTCPWQCVSQDIFELNKIYYLVTVDHYSDFYELDQLKDTLSTTVVQHTKAHFARHGIPLRCLTDNDYHLALLNIRNTPPRGYSFSSAQRLIGRRTCSSLPLCGERLLPDSPDPRTVTQEITNHRAASKATYDKTVQSSQPSLPMGSYAYAKPRPTLCGQPWTYGRIVSSPSPRSYNIDTGSHIIRRNRTQIRPTTAPSHISEVHPLQPYTSHSPQDSIEDLPPTTSDLEPDPPPATSSSQPGQGEVVTQTEELQQPSIQVPSHNTLTNPIWP